MVEQKVYEKKMRIELGQSSAKEQNQQKLPFKYRESMVFVSYLVFVQHVGSKQVTAAFRF